MNVIGIIGWKNSGKTTLVAAIIAELTRRGLLISTIKHTHHAVDLDTSGRDTWRHRKAGASQVMLASNQRWVIMTETDATTQANPLDLVQRLDPVDIVILEGFKGGSHPKIAIYRPDSGSNSGPDSGHTFGSGSKASLSALLEAKNIIAVATPAPLTEIAEHQSPWLNLNSPVLISNFIADYFGLST